MSSDGARNVVLVHGGFVDGSGWQGVYDSLTATASASASCRTPPCHWRATPTPRARSSTARTARSCWSATPTAARSSPRRALHPNVAALVYIAAFAPDKGESVSTLIAGFPADGPQPPILPPRTASCSWTGTNSTHRSPATCPPGWPRSWPTRRFPGGWTPSAERSAKPPGGPGQAGIWSPPRTG